MAIKKLLIVGNKGGTNVGGCFQRACLELGCESMVVETNLAYQGPKIWRSFCWRFFGRYPSSVITFENQLFKSVSSFNPDMILSVGITPPLERAVIRLKEKGIIFANYLTDDPFHKKLKSKWFLRSLRKYNYVFTTKKALSKDLNQINPNVIYLPFGYDPLFHYLDRSEPKNKLDPIDILFVGGGDQDRYPILKKLIAAGFRVRILGSYWEKDPVTKLVSLGQSSPDIVRQATKVAKISLCLVRRANRDGHVMRSFEIPAMGGCPLVEYTDEHREIFGIDGEAALFFHNDEEMVDKARWLLERPIERERLAKLSNSRIALGKNTYFNRLQSIINVVT